MKFFSFIQIVVIAATFPVYGEIETIQFHSAREGVGEGFAPYKSIVLSDDDQIVFQLPYAKEDMKGYFRKVNVYPVPFLCEGEFILTNAFTLKRGESVCWGDKRTWASLSYLWGSDVDEDIKCPDSYRHASRLIRLTVINTFYLGPKSLDLLFDLDRKMQFDIVGKKEFPYPHFPYRQNCYQAEHERLMKMQSEQLLDSAREKLVELEMPENIGDFALLDFACEQGWRESHFYERLTVTNRFTELIVAVRKHGSEWKITGFVGIPTFYCVRSHLLNEDGKLLMIAGEDPQMQGGELYAVRQDKYFGLLRGVRKYDENGNKIECLNRERLNREYETLRNAAFGWSGPFTIERLRERVATDAERIRRARESEKK